jgi:hypothetical protein
MEQMEGILMATMREGGCKELKNHMPDIHVISELAKVT